MGRVGVDLLAGLFVVGLLLWWIIKSDLEKRDFQKRCREENEKRDQKREVITPADRLRWKTDAERQIAWSARAAKQTKIWQELCRNAQDAEGLLPIETVSRILGWGTYNRSQDGKVVYDFRCSEGTDCYLESHHSQPFPKEIHDKFFRASDVILWLDERYRENARWIQALEDSATS